LVSNATHTKFSCLVVALAKGGWVLLIGNNGFCELLIGGNMATISGDD